MWEEEASTSLKVVLLMFALVMIGTLTYFVKDASVTNYQQDSNGEIVIKHKNITSIDKP